MVPNLQNICKIYIIMYDHIFPKHLMTWGNFHNISENSGYMQFDLIVDCLLPTLTYRLRRNKESTWFYQFSWYIKARKL